MAKVIKIGHQMFVLPAGMTSKDIQALVGFVATLEVVDSAYNFETGHSMHYSTGTQAVQLLDVELMPEPEARKLHNESHEAYMARRAAQAAQA